MRILKESTAGLIIDIQERLYPHIHEHEAVARNTGILVEGLRFNLAKHDLAERIAGELRQDLREKMKHGHLGPT